MRHFFTKLTIVAVWVAIIFSVLVAPKIEWNKNCNDRSIDVFVWGDYFDPKLIADFEEKSDIKVRFHSYSSNEEMIMKLRAHKGIGYDVVIPSDYAVQILIKEKLLQPIDYKKVDFVHKITPSLLNHSYDPGNKYSLPNMWMVYGIGYDKNYFKNQPLEPTLGQFFNPALFTYKLSMTPDPVEAIVFASCYLYGDVDTLNDNQAKEVKNLLLKQKPYVEAYADYRAKYLMQTKNCPLAVLGSSFLFHIARSDENMGFMIPKEATFVSIESVAIPVGSTKQELVYQFLNFLYSESAQASQVAICPLFPASESSLNLTNEHPDYYKIYQQTMQNPKFLFIRYLLSEEKIRDMWVEIKN